MQRYFGVLKNEDSFILTPSDIHHIKRVMRMKEKEEIEVVYQEEVYLCYLENINTDLKIKIKRKQIIKSDFMKHIVLIIPVLKEQKMDLILQKATELGVSEIIPVMMKRSMVKIENKSEKRLERWKMIVKEASEQSHRYNIPIIHSVTTLKEVSSLEGINIICSTVEAKNTFKMFLQTHKNYDKLNIVIGPEGGLDPTEELELQSYGFIPVTLGQRIMRVETVPIYLLSILNYEYME